MDSPPTPGPVVAPWIVVDGAAGLLDFVVGVLGATELGRMPGPDGVVGHAEVDLGGTRLVVMDAREGWVASPARLRVGVAGLAQLVERARAAGGEVSLGPILLPTGELMAVVRDPWGGRWWLQERVEEWDVSELLRRLDEPGAHETMAAFEAALDADQRRG